MSSDSPPAAQRRKQRVDVACDFCRQRKLGCNNAKPKCENCYENQKECSYSVRIGKERPSNSRIVTLKEENVRLRKELERLQSVPSFQEPQIRDEARQVVASSTLGPLASRSLGRTLSSEKQLTKVSQTSVRGLNTNTSTEINSSPDSHGTQFHGPTSAMFDGKHPLERKNVDPIAVVDTSQRAQLLAESARQRQLELINLRSGKLNFDGLDPELGMVLLSVFWNRQHATGSIVYRPCFMRDMASKGPHFSPLLLNTIFFVASKHVASKDGPRLEGSCNSIDNCNSGLLFRRKVDNILHHPETQVLCKSSITTVQALLIMSDALFSWCDERSLSWHYLGIAINMIIDLGIHSEKCTLMLAKSQSPEEMETHRRLFWAAFVLDKVQAIYQGRPARLRDMDNSVPMVFLDDYEELEPFDTLGYSATPGDAGLPIHSVSTFEHLCKLSVIADRILYSLYAEKSSQINAEELCRTSHILHRDLTTWHESLPVHLSVDFDTSGRPNTSSGCVVLPHTLSLISMFYALLILLHRPFVSEGHLKSTATSATSAAFSICETAASDIDVLLKWYKSQWCIKSPPYFISYSTYVSATIHVRTAAQKPPGSKAHVRLRNCLEILSEHQVVCHAPRRAMSILLGLVRRLKVDVGGAFTASVSRTAECEETSCDNTRSSFLESYDLLRKPHTPEVVGAMDTPNLTAQHPIQPPNPTTESDDIPSAAINNHCFSHLNPSSHPVNYSFDETIPDMSFAFDPLFGFNDFDFDTDMNIELGF